MSQPVLPFKRLLRDFLRCGMAGWCMEILFTSLQNLRRRNFKLMGNTSIWMFPIYGSAALLRPLSHLMRKRSLCFRGMLYMLLIYCVEFFSGRMLQKRNLCPWDYGKSPYHLCNVIRLDYAPCWFFAGLLFEKLSKD